MEEELVWHYNGDQLEFLLRLCFVAWSQELVECFHSYQSHFCRQRWHHPICNWLVLIWVEGFLQTLPYVADKPSFLNKRGNVPCIPEAILTRWMHSSAEQDKCWKPLRSNYLGLVNYFTAFAFVVVKVMSCEFITLRTLPTGKVWLLQKLHE